MLSVVLLQFVDLFVLVFDGLILLRVVASWIVRDPESNRLVQLIHDVTEPMLGPLKRVLPAAGGLDLSPIVAYFLLQGLQYLVHRLILGS